MNDVELKCRHHFILVYSNNSHFSEENAHWTLKAEGQRKIESFLSTRPGFIWSETIFLLRSAFSSSLIKFYLCSDMLILLVIFMSRILYSSPYLTLSTSGPFLSFLPLLTVAFSTYLRPLHLSTDWSMALFWKARKPTCQSPMAERGRSLLQLGG